MARNVKAKLKDVTGGRIDENCPKRDKEAGCGDCPWLFEGECMRHRYVPVEAGR